MGNQYSRTLKMHETKVLNMNKGYYNEIIHSIQQHISQWENVLKFKNRFKIIRH